VREREERESVCERERGGERERETYRDLFNEGMGGAEALRRSGDRASQLL
jgi:hypothetical protein